MVAGPASAVVLAIRRLGWRPLTYCRWHTGNGMTLDLEDMAPNWIRAVARRSFRSVQWEDWAKRTSHSPEHPEPPRDPRGYWIEPVAAMMNVPEDATTWNLSPQARGALRSTVIGAQWSQLRLHKMGYSDTSSCQRCGQTGDLHHRFWKCSYHSEARSRAVDEELVEMAKRSHVADPFFT
eukprot:1686897-Pyramimonas_sp.AAC.1